jgi:hypothetical protein
MSDVNYVDLKAVPDTVQETINMAASNASNLARVLKTSSYPGAK